MTLEETVDDALHNPTIRFTLPQIARWLEKLGETGMATVLYERIHELESALKWIKTT